MPDLTSLSPILLTGATSHTGRRLAARLLDEGAALRCLVHTPAHREWLPQSPRLEVVFGSADDPAELRLALENVPTVVHLAGHRFAPLLIETLAELGRPFRLVFQSSTRLLSRYPTPVRESVREAERAIKAAPKQIAWTILRPSLIFGGPEDNNLERLARFLRRSRLVPIFGRGRNLVQPLFVWDLVAAHLACLERPISVGRVYNLAGPEALTYRAMVEAVARAAGTRAPVFVPLPPGLSLSAARLFRRIWPASPLNPEMIERFGEDKAFDVEPAQRDLDFEPTALEQALARKFHGQA